LKKIYKFLNKSLLRSPYPVLSFQSTNIIKLFENEYEIRSQLAILTQAKDVEAIIQIIETTNINVNHGSTIVEAALQGRNDIVERLIAAGADVNIIRQDNVNINNIYITCYLLLNNYSML
jgi:ankyrin repeat protein